MSEEKFVKNWKVKIFTVKLFSCWEKVRGFSGEGSKAQGLGHRAVGPCPAPPWMPQQLFEGWKGASAPRGAFPALRLRPLVELSPAKAGRSLRAMSWGRRGPSAGRKTTL